MPDDIIRLSLPAVAAFTPVASVAVRAAARQVALSEVEIDRLRAALVAALEDRIANADDAPIAITLEATPGSLLMVLDGEPVG
jgi:hypothetical protein